MAVDPNSLKPLLETIYITYTRKRPLLVSGVVLLVVAASIVTTIIKSTSRTSDPLDIVQVEIQKLKADVQELQIAELRDEVDKLGDQAGALKQRSPAERDEIEGMQRGVETLGIVVEFFGREGKGGGVERVGTGHLVTIPWDGGSFTAVTENGLELTAIYPFEWIPGPSDYPADVEPFLTHPVIPEKYTLTVEDVSDIGTGYQTTLVGFSIVSPPVPDFGHEDRPRPVAVLRYDDTVLDSVQIYGTGEVAVLTRQVGGDWEAVSTKIIASRNVIYFQLTQEEDGEMEMEIVFAVAIK